MPPLGLKGFSSREETWNRQRAGSYHLWRLLQRKRRVAKWRSWRRLWHFLVTQGYFSRVDCVFSDLSSCVFFDRGSMQSQVECVSSGRSNACTSKSWIAFFLTHPACRICWDCRREAKRCHLRLGDMVFLDGAYRVVVWYLVLVQVIGVWNGMRVLICLFFKIGFWFSQQRTLLLFSCLPLPPRWNESRETMFSRCLVVFQTLMLRKTGRCIFYGLTWH